MLMLAPCRRLVHADLPDTTVVCACLLDVLVTVWLIAFDLLPCQVSLSNWVPRSYGQHILLAFNTYVFITILPGCKWL